MMVTTKVQLFSVPISITKLGSALALVTSWLSKRFNPSGLNLKGLNLFRSKIIVTPNPEIVVAAQTDRGLMAALQAADLAIPDGHGIVWAVRWLTHPSSFSRLSGLTLMEALVAKAARRGWRVMLLGGRPGVAPEAARALCEFSEAPQLSKYFKVIGLSGPQEIEHMSNSDSDQLIHTINKFKPDLLFVGFGHGKQEKWMIQNRHRVRARVMMAVGGAFDQLADPSLRSPQYIDSIGLGWLWRLMRQPWRWRRQLVLMRFLLMVVKSRFNFMLER